MCIQIIERYAICGCIHGQRDGNPCASIGMRGHSVKAQEVRVGLVCSLHFCGLDLQTKSLRHRKFTSRDKDDAVTKQAGDKRVERTELAAREKGESEQAFKRNIKDRSERSYTRFSRLKGQLSLIYDQRLLVDEEAEVSSPLLQRFPNPPQSYAIDNLDPSLGHVLRSLAQYMQGPWGIRLSNRHRGFILYRNSFYVRHFVQWVEDYFGVADTSTAIEFGTQLVKVGLISQLAECSHGLNAL